MKEIMSEEIKYCNNCSYLGLDFKTGKFYCGLSNRKDELPEILSCENFSSNCYIKRLQGENEELKKTFKKIDKLLDEALDSEVTDMEQSLDRLYTISEMIGKVLNGK